MTGRPKQDCEPSLVSHRREITQAMLKEILNYDPATGIFTWACDRGYKPCKGLIAGSKDKGRWTIGVFGKRCPVSNLAWLWMTGKWPLGEIDHIDRNPDNDKWLNLRDVTHSQNSMNQTVRRNNKAGHKGVHQHKSGQWRAKIVVNGFRYDLGLYPTAEYAAAAYRIAAAGIHGEFSGVGK